LDSEVVIETYVQAKHNDIIPAKSLGMHTIWVKQGFGRYWNITKEIERADCSVDNLSELCDNLYNNFKM